MKDPAVKIIMKIKLPERQTMIEGQFFKDHFFPQDTMQALMKHPLIKPFEAEHAIFTTDEH